MSSRGFSLLECNTRLTFLHLLLLVEILPARNNKTRFLSLSYPDKIWVFDQSEHEQGPIYDINEDNALLLRTCTRLSLYQTSSVLYAYLSLSI